MIPVSDFYDEYFDRPKLSEQKKAICVYSSSPSKRVGTKYYADDQNLIRTYVRMYRTSNLKKFVKIYNF